MADVPTPDKADIALMRWRATEELVKLSREATEMYDLDPDLLEAVEDAASDDDFDEIVEAIADLWHDLAEAKGLL